MVYMIHWEPVPLGRHPVADTSRSPVGCCSPSVTDPALALNVGFGSFVHAVWFYAEVLDLGAFSDIKEHSYHDHS